MRVIAPQRGAKHNLVRHALDNAREALARRLGESASQRRLLEGLARLLDLDAAPERIEVYDNSHVGGTEAMGAMIVAGPEGWIKNAYRKFSIRNPEARPATTYAMMREVLTRRFGRAVSRRPRPNARAVAGPGADRRRRRPARRRRAGACKIWASHRRGGGDRQGPDRNAGRERIFLPDRPPLQPNARSGAVLPAAAARRGASLRHWQPPRAPLRQARDVDARRDPRHRAGRKKALLHHFGSAKASSAPGSPISRWFRASAGRSPRRSMTGSTPSVKMERASPAHDRAMMEQPSQRAHRLAHSGDAGGLPAAVRRDARSAAGSRSPSGIRLPDRLPRRLSRAKLAAAIELRSHAGSDRRQAPGRLGAAGAGRRRPASGASILPAAIILCREILVSGLREFLAQLQVSVPVTGSPSGRRRYRWWPSAFWWSATPARGRSCGRPRGRGRRPVGRRGADAGHRLRLSAGGAASRGRRSRLSRRSAIQAGRSRRRRMRPGGAPVRVLYFRLGSREGGTGGGGGDAARQRYRRCRPHLLATRARRRPGEALADLSLCPRSPSIRNTPVSISRSGKTTRSPSSRRSPEAEAVAARVQPRRLRHRRRARAVRPGRRRGVHVRGPGARPE